jgi:hypothetical protein
MRVLVGVVMLTFALGVDGAGAKAQLLEVQVGVKK